MAQPTVKAVVKMGRLCDDWHNGTSDGKRWLNLAKASSKIGSNAETSQPHDYREPTEALSHSVEYPALDEYDLHFILGRHHIHQGMPHKYSIATIALKQWGFKREKQQRRSTR